MKKQNIKGKSISELRTLAKQAGVSAKRNWKKEDYEKALSAGPGRPASKKKLPKASAVKAKPAEKVKKTARKMKAGNAPKVSVKKPVPRKKTKPVANVPTKKVVVKKAPVRAAKKSAVADSVKKASKARNAKVALKKTGPAFKSIVKNKVSNKKPAPPAKSINPEATLPPKKTSGLKAKNGTKHAPMFSGKASPTVAKTGIGKVKHGENTKILVAMPVTPKRIYVYWEITPDQASKLKGSLNLRIVGTKKKRHVYLYLPVSERISEQFVQVSPGSKYVAEIGVINRKGRFVRAMRSKPVKTPPATGGIKGVPEKQIPPKISDEKVLSDESFELIGSVSSY